MTPHIYEFSPFTVAGWPSRHQKDHMKTTGDAPTFWNSIQMDYGPVLTRLYELFPKSKHCEISMCYDVDEATGEFSYILGRGIDNPEDLDNIQPGMILNTMITGITASISAESFRSTSASPSGRRRRPAERPDFAGRSERLPSPAVCDTPGPGRLFSGSTFPAFCTGASSHR